MREGHDPLAPVTRGAVGEPRAPRLRRQKRKSSKEQPASSETNPSTEPPRESARGCEPSRLSIEAGDLRVGKVACPKGKQVASRPTKRNRRFRLVAPGADFFGVGARPPGEKIASLQIPRPETQRISAESEKGWCGGESVPSAPGELERAAALSTFNQKDFPQGNRILFLRRGSGGGACSPAMRLTP